MTQFVVPAQEDRPYLERIRVRTLLVAFALLLPNTGVLFGRTLDASRISAETALSSSGRMSTALISGALIFGLLFATAGKSWQVFPRGSRLPWLSVGFFCSLALASLVIGTLRGNPTGFVLSGGFNMYICILLLFLGSALGQISGEIRRIVLYTAIIGLVIILSEEISALASGSTLYVRYGTGLAMRMFPFFLLAAITLNKKWFWALSILSIIVYVIFSGSRSQLGTLVSLFCIYAIWLRHVAIVGSQKFRIFPSLINLLLFVGGFAIVIFFIQSFGISWNTQQDNNAWTTIVERSQSTVAADDSGGLNSLGNLFSTGLNQASVEAMKGEIDLSNFGRLMEAVDVLSAQKSTLFGNGLGAVYTKTYKTTPFTPTTAHYIHITPLLIFFRMGLTGLIAYALIGIMSLTAAMRALRRPDQTTRACAMGVILASATCMLSFPFASGPFFSSFGVMLFFTGLMFGRISCESTLNGSGNESSGN